MNKEILGDMVEFVYEVSMRIEYEPKGKYPICGDGAIGFIYGFKI